MACLILQWLLCDYRNAIELVISYGDILHSVAPLAQLMLGLITRFEVQSAKYGSDNAKGAERSQLYPLILQLTRILDTMKTRSSGVMTNKLSICLNKKWEKL